MPRTVSAPILVFAGLAWLVVGLLVSGLVGSALQTAMPADDPRRETLSVAALLLGGAVTVIGFTVTIGIARGRTTRATLRGTVAPNTLRGDAIRQPRAAFGRMPMPVAPLTSKTARPGATRTWAPGRPPPPAASSAVAPAASSSFVPAASGTRPNEASGPWAWTPRGQASGVLPKAPIPGAQTVGPARPTAGWGGAAATRRSRMVAPVILAFGVGALLAYEQGTRGAIDAGGWIVFAVLLLAAGAALPGRRGQAASSVGWLAAVSVAPILVVGLVASEGRQPGTTDVIVTTAVAGAVGSLLIRVGASFGGGRLDQR
jgi:hypothetical protein